MRRGSILIVLGGLIIVALLSQGSRLAFAQDTGAGFTITPPIFELKANPGDRLDEVVSVFNNGSSDLAIAVTVENLKPQGEVGQVQIVGENQEALPSLKDWVKAKTLNFELKKGETKNVKFTIEVPGNAEPGGHFASILFGTTNFRSPNETGSTVSQKIGSLLLLTVTGQAKEEARVVSFKPRQRLFYKEGLINFDLRIENKGNVYVRPRGFLIINNIFGRKTAQVETDGKNILPGVIRQIPIEYKGRRLFGPYTATLSLVYGNTNQNINASAGFWVIPWLPTTIALVCLVIVILLRRRLWRAFLILIGRRH